MAKQLIPPIVGLAEAADLLGWDKRHVGTYIQRGKFPEPAARLASGPIWTKKQIEQFIIERTNQMEIKAIKSLHESVGTVIPSKEHGNVKIIGFSENKDWGSTVIIYLDRPHMDNAIGRFENSGKLNGGALTVVQTTEPVTTFD